MSVENFPEPWQKKLADLATAHRIEIEELTVTENGTYSEEGKAYSPVTVNVSGGGGATEYNIYCYTYAGEAIESYIYPCIWDETSEQWTLDTTNGAISKAKAGDILGTDYANGIAFVQYAEGSSSPYPPYITIGQKEFSMPAHDAYVYQALA